MGICVLNFTNYQIKAMAFYPLAIIYVGLAPSIWHLGKHCQILNKIGSSNTPFSVVEAHFAYHVK